MILFSKKNYAKSQFSISRVKWNFFWGWFQSNGENNIPSEIKPTLTDQISYMLFNCHYLLGKNILLDLIFPPKYRFSKKNGLCIQNVYNFNKWKQLAKLFSGAKIEGCSGHPMQYVPGHNRVKLFTKPNSKNQVLWFHEIFFYLMIKCANH